MDEIMICNDVINVLRITEMDGCVEKCCFWMKFLEVLFKIGQENLRIKKIPENSNSIPGFDLNCLWDPLFFYFYFYI